MDEPQDYVPLTDQTIALTDAIKAVLDILIASGIAAPAALGQIYEQMRDEKLRKECVQGASIMEILRQFVTDENRAAQRAAIRTLLREQPKGEA